MISIVPKIITIAPQKQVMHPKNQYCSPIIIVACQQPVSQPKNQRCTPRISIASQESVLHPKNQHCTPRISIAPQQSVLQPKYQRCFPVIVSAPQRSATCPKNRHCTPEISTAALYRKKDHHHAPNISIAPQKSSVPPHAHLLVLQAVQLTAVRVAGALQSHRHRRRLGRRHRLLPCLQLLLSLQPRGSQLRCGDIPPSVGTSPPSVGTLPWSVGTPLGEWCVGGLSDRSRDTREMQCQRVYCEPVAEGWG